jgi:putative endonuclease
MAPAHALGHRGETLAAWLVRLRGGRVLARNTRVRGACEVDIVARYGRTLAVIEVKARRAGGAAEAVGPERVAGLSRAAQWLADSRGYEWVQLIRLDLVTIDGHRVRYLADAFRL